MQNEEFYDDNFIIHLKIEGTSYEDVEVNVTDTQKPIRDQINSIVQVFELPKMDGGGNPIEYLLGQMVDDEDEPQTMEFFDEEGREMTFEDYNIQPGDTLLLIKVPIAG